MINSKPKILIVSRSSFGYQAILYQWCKKLQDYYDITYICFEDRFGRDTINVEHIKVEYISYAGNKLLRSIRFLSVITKKIGDDYDLCIIHYFPLCCILRLLKPYANVILDIRTGSIKKSKLIRTADNLLLKSEAYFFQNKIILAESLAKRLNISDFHVVPLGSDIISMKKKDFKKFDLLYVGTLQDREIEKTIIGFSKFYLLYSGKLNLSYTIIGRGSGNEVNELRKLVDSLGLNHVVRILGYIKYDDLCPFFDLCNVGVSFIPMTEYFDSQPPTKTFEYLLSGMPTIATNTSENRYVINDVNGILVNDTIEDFLRGLIELYARRSRFDSDKIRSTAVEYTWDNIIINNLKPYLDNLL